MYRLTPRVQHYAWGSHSDLAQLSGRPAPTDMPEAELWLGAHEEAPCELALDGETTTLDRAILGDPVSMLGETTVSQFQRRLPFLLKVLAAEQALSIQCHPSREEALTAPTGTYVDSWPKPEAWLTVTEFEVFACNQSMDEIASLATELACPEFSALVADCAGAGVKALIRQILEADAQVRSALTTAVVSACSTRRNHPHFDAIRRIAEQFPDDEGLAVLLTMRHHIVPPGQYIFVPAGVLHSIVRGVTVEVLANSDNVVRAGLTPKELNIPELLRIVDVERSVVPEVAPDGDRVHSYPVDVPYFQLHQIGAGVDEIEMPGHHKPRIVLCLGGTITLDDGSRRLELGPSEACFIAACAEPVRCSGDGTAYVATTGLVG
ncbi:mannose-6-phosphate isomerase, class I [Yimella sp. cx-573]|nr:mannose-6-phosphate isomerase, class I [Yimella sp. cx-573]